MSGEALHPDKEYWRRGKFVQGIAGMNSILDILSFGWWD